MPLLEQEGIFRGSIIDYGITESDKSASKAVTLVVLIEEIFHEGGWHDWSEYQLQVRGDFWVVRRDGTINDSTVKTLVEVTGWSGSFASIVLRDWAPPKVQVVVEEDEYNGKVRHRIAWLNEYDREPNAKAGNVDTEGAKTLDKLLGPQMKALVGSVTRGSADKAPAEKPKKPSKSGSPKAKKAPAKTPAPPEASAGPPEDDEIPF